MNNDSLLYKDKSNINLDLTDITNIDELGNKNKKSELIENQHQSITHSTNNNFETLQNEVNINN